MNGSLSEKRKQNYHISPSPSIACDRKPTTLAGIVGTPETLVGGGCECEVR
ncbi:hypothetical protein GW17_00018523 [Ensete ventricosum]|nr:hypothetical protein GW17_00018523 [Ensete ventricosum]